MRSTKTFILLGLNLLVVGTQFSVAAPVATHVSQSGGFPVSKFDLLQLPGTTHANFNAAGTPIGDTDTLFTFADSGTSAGVSVLTNGQFGANGTPPNSDFAGIRGETGNSKIVYTFDTSAYSLGYSIYAADVFTGWNDGGRDNIDFTLEYSTVSAPGTFVSILSDSFTDGANHKRVTVADGASAPLATNVKSVRFGFPLQENGGVGYRELDIQGVPTGVMAISYSQQTNSGLPFTPSYTVSSTDLIQGMSPSASTGDFTLESSGGTPVLTNGTATITGHSSFATAGDGSGSGSSLTYSLNLLANPLGYNLTGIDVYGGWNDGGRDEQAYLIEYSTAANPGTFLRLTNVNYEPAATGNASATRVSITPLTPFLATGVAALRFSFDNVENGYTGYSEIDVFGVAAVPEPATLGLLAASAFGLLTIRRRHIRTT